MSALTHAAGVLPVSRVEAALPKFGAWRADVLFASGEPPADGAAATLTVGDLDLVGSVQRAGLDAPGRPHATVVGGAGWEQVLEAPLSYRSDAGVLLSTVLRDLAARAGETIEQPTDRTIGPRFGAPAGTRLRDVLAALQRTGKLAPWRADPDGVTRFGARAGTTTTARATELRRDAALGVVTLGIDSPAAFLPGAVLEDGSIVERLVVRETAGKLEADAWVSSGGFRASILRMVAEAFPVLVYGYPRTYVVAAVRADKTLDLEPPPDARYLPPLAAAEQWGLGGALVTPAQGAEVMVAFRDADPTRYAVVGFAPGTPTKVAIDADAVELGAGERVAAAPGDEEGKAVAYGDTVQMFIGAAATPTPIKLMRVGSLIDLAGNPVANVSKVKA